MRTVGYFWRNLFDIHSIVIMKSIQIFLLVILLNVISLAQNDNPPTAGRYAPNFTLENLDREIVEFKNYLGTGPVLLCFWSSCCKSAIEQLEAFSTLYDKYKDKNFVLLAIATDDEKTIAKVKPLVKIKKYNFPVLYDTEGKVSRLYYAFDRPFYVLIDYQGKIINSRLGYMRGDEIELGNKIKWLLK